MRRYFLLDFAGKRSPQLELVLTSALHRFTPRRHFHQKIAVFLLRRALKDACD
jgi:hypothetical protein